MKLFKRSQAKVEPPSGQRTARSCEPGEQRARVFSYYANRSEGENSVGRAADRRVAGPLRRFTRRVGMLALIIAVLVAAIDELSLSSTPQITPLATQAGQVFLRNKMVYQHAANVLFASSLENRDKLTINTDKISAMLRREFPELRAVSVALPVLGHRPIVYVQPSEPSMILTTKSSGSFILDAGGEALVPAVGHITQLTDLHVPIVVDQSGLAVKIGQTTLPGPTVDFIQIVAAQLAAQHIGFNSMLLPPRAAGELDVYLAGEPFFVKFNTEENTALQQIGTFIAVLRHLQAQGTIPRSYIDVRISGRAYYK